MAGTLTYTQEDILRLVEADVLARESPRSMLLNVVRTESSTGESSFEVRVELNAPQPASE